MGLATPLRRGEIIEASTQRITRTYIYKDLQMACAKFIQKKINIHELQKEIIEIKKILCSMEKQSRLSLKDEDPIRKNQNEAIQKKYIEAIHEYLKAIGRIEVIYKDVRAFNIEEGLLQALEADKKLAEIRHGIETNRKKEEEVQTFIKGQDQQKNLKGMADSLRRNFFNQPHLTVPAIPPLVPRMITGVTLKTPTPYKTRDLQGLNKATNELQPPARSTNELPPPARSTNELLPPTRSTNELPPPARSTNELQTPEMSTYELQESSPWDTKDISSYYNRPEPVKTPHETVNKIQRKKEESQNFLETARKLQESVENINRVYGQQMAQKSFSSLSEIMQGSSEKSNFSSELSGDVNHCEAPSGLNDTLDHINLSARSKRLLTKKERIYDLLKEAELFLSMEDEEEIKKLTDKFNHYDNMLFMELDRLGEKTLPEEIDQKFHETKDILILCLKGFKRNMENMITSLEERKEESFNSIKEELDKIYGDLDRYFTMYKELENSVE